MGFCVQKTEHAGGGGGVRDEMGEALKVCKIYGGNRPKVMFGGIGGAGFEMAMEVCWSEILAVAIGEKRGY